MACDTSTYVVLACISIALAISLGMNVILYSLRRRDKRRTAVEDYPFSEHEAYHMESDEVALDQQNPIYGNINPGRTGVGGVGGGEVFYEHMTTCSREEEPPHQDVSYASLDLVVGQKRRKKQRRKKAPQLDQGQSDRLSQPEFLEVEVEVESGMPCRNSSPMISRNSIYLNSQQVAQESGELERARERAREDLMNLDCVHDDPTRFFSRANHSLAFELDSR